jgi:uncharacterized membrane protein YdfJ with MMPL/SSD domain
MTTERREGDVPREVSAPAADELSETTHDATGAEVADEGYGAGVVDPATGLVDTEDDVTDPGR